MGWVDPPTAVTNGGTFTLTHGAHTTAPIPFNASDSTIQAALAALPNIGLGNVSVAWTETSFPQNFGNHKYKLTFRGALAGQNVPQTTINTSSLVVTPNQPVTKTEQTTVQGSQIAEQQSIQFTVPSWNTATGSWYLAYAGEVSNPLSPYATPATVAAELNQFAGIDNVTVTGSSGSFIITFGGTQASIDMQNIMVDVSNLAQANGSTFDRTFTNSYNAVGELNSVAESNHLTPSFTRNIAFTRDNLGRATNITTNHNKGTGDTQFCQVDCLSSENGSGDIAPRSFKADKRTGNVIDVRHTGTLNILRWLARTAPEQGAQNYECSVHSMLAFKRCPTGFRLMVACINDQQVGVIAFSRSIGEFHDNSVSPCELSGRLC